MFRPDSEEDIGGRRVVLKIHYGVVYVLCVRDLTIQRCRHAPEHMHIHILMQTLMYVEVWNIMVCNQNVPDPNKHDRTPDVIRERP